MNGTKKRKRRVKRKFIRLTVAVFFLLTLTLSCYVGYKKHTGKEYINYKETNVLEYIVCYIQPNELNQGCLSQTINNYVTKYIDNIKLNFTYKLDLNKEVHTTYKYKIIGELTIFDRNNHSLVMERKEYDLLAEKEITKENIDKLTINELLNLNYKEYDQYVTNYKNNANVSAAANLRVTLLIETSNKHNEVSKEIKTSNNMIIDIPLGEHTIQLNTNYIPNNQSQNIEIKTNETLINNILKVLSIISGIIGLIFIIVTINEFYKKHKAIPIYTRLINELKNDFDYEISEISSLIDDDNYEYFNAISFKELYDLVKTSTDKKILWNEKQFFDNKGRLENRISWFFVFMSDTKIMRFVIDENELTTEYESNPNILKKYKG